MGSSPVNLGGSIVRTPGYKRFTRRPWAAQPPEVPRFLSMGCLTAQPGQVSRHQSPENLGDSSTPAAHSRFTH
ncbi:hypothetical protein B296_00022973 [Ensete ventricosum]|uniref:Uncharacterized protein n=1 Tax=Ensete ventricosum TaxID=4639 RepID=A0A426YUF8_ENSVE|nr:hypothetical protein B296_00022973 [Ensete ventricosum]